MVLINRAGNNIMSAFGIILAIFFGAHPTAVCFMLVCLTVERLFFFRGSRYFSDL
jgi:hypothetical protein